MSKTHYRVDYPRLRPKLAWLLLLAGLETPAAIGGFAAEKPVAVEKRIAAGSDDVKEFDGTGKVRLTSKDLEMVMGEDPGETQTIGLRFTGLAIPPGAKIAGAYVQFALDDPSSGEASLVIHGEAADNAPTFTSASKNVSSRRRTSSKVTWAPPEWNGAEGEAGPAQRTPDLAAVIQEIVSRPGWASGNSLVLIITGKGRRVAESFEGAPAAAPLLRIEYLPGQ